MDNTFVWQNSSNGQFKRIARLIEVNRADFSPEHFAKVSSDFGRVQRDLGTSGELSFSKKEVEGLSKAKNVTEGMVKAGYIKSLVIWEESARKLFKATTGDLRPDWQEEMRIPLPRELKAEFGLID